MGGNLFKLGRMPRAQYLEREAQLRAYLQQKIGEHFRIPRYYQSKVDFGDMDVIVSADAAGSGSWTDLRQAIVEELGIEQTQSAGDLFSTVYRGLQVDFFHRQPEIFESTANYMSFNDAGNLLGKICRRLGLKYGEDGLSWVYRRQGDDHYRRDLLLSRDPQEIFSFLDLDFDKWRQGFDAIEEIFEWVIASRYFSVTPYQRPTRRIRERTKVRPTIARFLDYLEERSIDKTFDYAEDRRSYIPKVAAFFPRAQLETQIAREERAAERAGKLRDAFSGRLVMSLVPLRGAALGGFMKAFRATYSEDSLLQMSDQDIAAAILSLHQERES